MPSTGRQRWLITATWGAESTAPVSYTKRRISREGYPLDAESVHAVDLTAAGMVRVKFPAAIGGGADALKFKGAATANANSDADVLDFSYAQDQDGADLVVSSVAGSLGQSRQVPLDICSCFFVIPVFVDAGGDAVAPGAISVEFHIKE